MRNAQWAMLFLHGLTSATAALSRYLFKDHQLMWDIAHWTPRLVSDNPLLRRRRLDRQILLPPLQFLVIPMRRVPRRPPSVICIGVANEFRRDAPFFERHVHLLGLLDRHPQISFTVNEERRRRDIRGVH